MNSLYTPEVRNYIDSRPWPKGLQYDIYEKEEVGGNILYLVFFRDNWIQLEPRDHLIITEIVKETITKLRGDGVPISFGAIRTRGDNDNR